MCDKVGETMSNPTYSIEAHPKVIHETQRHSELLSRLATVRTEHAGLIKKKTRLQQERHEDEVRAQLGEGEAPSPAMIAQLTELDETIAELARQAVVINEAIGRQAARLKTAHLRVRAELRETIFADVRAATAAQNVALEEILRHQVKLTNAFRSGLLRPHELPPVCFQMWTLAPAWQRAVRAMGASVTEQPAEAEPVGA